MLRTIDAPAAAQTRHLTISVETRDRFEVVDITPAVVRVVEGFGFRDGVVTVLTRHTTMGLLINEHEPLLMSDLQAMFERLVPENDYFAHDDFAKRTVNISPGERRNGWAHCRAALLRTSESVPVADGTLSLGRWQRVLLVEFDGGQRREISLAMSGRFRSAGPDGL